MELLYKVGDKVMVRKDIQEKGHYHMVSCTESPGYKGMYVNDDTAAKAGKLVTIRAIIEDENCGYKYKIKEDSWSWTDEMFERKRNSISFKQLL